MQVWVKQTRAIDDGTRYATRYKAGKQWGVVADTASNKKCQGAAHYASKLRGCVKLDVGVSPSWAPIP